MEETRQIIEPSIGRVVWYTPRNPTPGDQPRVALIARVWGTRCVNLAIFDGNGNPVVNPPTSIVLVQPGDPKPEGGNYCEWMPYQISTAKAA